MKKQEYLDLKKRHEEELNNFPIAYAFNDEQLKQALEKLGVKSKDECVTVFGHGDIVKRGDAKKFIDMLKRHTKEVRDAITNDKDLAVAAFLYEMNNHEYCINYDGDGDVLGCFGLEWEDLEKLDLETAYRIARKEHMRLAHEEWGVI